MLPHFSSTTAAIGAIVMISRCWDEGAGSHEMGGRATAHVIVSTVHSPVWEFDHTHAEIRSRSPSKQHVDLVVNHE